MSQLSMSLDPASASPTWSVSTRQPQAEATLMRELGVPPLVAAVLASRGLIDPAAAHTFLNPSLDQLHDPRLLPDFEKALEAILGARERGELIYIHGDYDVDGITSAALLGRFLASIGCKVQTHVPHRMKEGYGIHETAVAAAAEAGAKLFLTCDCGSSAHQQVALAKAAGMKVVITDHHLISDLPDAEAVINPHREDSRYPFPELSGVGVAFKLCEGITEHLGFPKEGYYRAFLDLAALGTIADVMPLRGENRILARFGLEALAQTKKVGLKALMQIAEIKPPLRSYHVGYVIGPRLNAAGRIDDAALALQLLLETDEQKAFEIATEIEAVNKARRDQQEKILEQAVQMVTDQGLDQKNVIVVANSEWHPGVIGIVAGRLVEQFRRPAFVLAHDTEKGICKGSARTIPQFHLGDAIAAHREMLLSGGGHAMAAGCSFDAALLEQFYQSLDGYAGNLLTAEDFVPKIHADLEVTGDEITYEALEALAQMEPFGCENPEPSFLCRRVTFTEMSPTRNPAHVKVGLLPPNGSSAAGMAFGLGERLGEEATGLVADILFRPCLDTWNGRTYLKWHVRDYVA